MILIKCQLELLNLNPTGSLTGSHENFVKLRLGSSSVFTTQGDFKLEKFGLVSSLQAKLNPMVVDTGKGQWRWRKQ